MYLTFYKTSFFSKYYASLLFSSLFVLLPVVIKTVLEVLFGFVDFEILKYDIINENLYFTLNLLYI